MTFTLKKTFLAAMLAPYLTPCAFADVTFSYEDETDATNLHVTMTGTTKGGKEWTAKDFQTPADTAFLMTHHNDERVMSLYGTGKPRDPEATKERVEGNWKQRFVKGNPHGGMVLFDAESNHIGHVVAGGGDGNGVSEIAYSVDPAHWNKGYMSSIVGTVVTEWAPKVREIGLNKDNKYSLAMQGKFTCFGDEVLRQLDATASPNNPGSWHVLEKHGFTGAVTNVVGSVAGFTLNLNLNSHGQMDTSAVRSTLKNLFDGDTVEAGKRYSVACSDGKTRTLSYSEKFGMFKFHYELDLTK